MKQLNLFKKKLLFTTIQQNRKKPHLEKKQLNNLIKEMALDKIIRIAESTKKSKEKD